MPTYHFICDACGKAFEENLPMGSAVPPCPHCKSGDIRKIIKPPMVHFKGSGFYKTDSGGGKQTPKEPKADAKPVESKPETPKPDAPKKPDSPAKPA